ncbi:GFA family protein [Sphingomonas cannabina]|uniref:GFA family protein n=1 Tax=Sphingomonas cannabina TaxID=2899123 RepID=UPI001F420D38|nr:GFA family protein [Sphingomonas cannabina]UIJ45660.1 GFA family protein [Sphingomonas cannabina]
MSVTGSCHCGAVNYTLDEPAPTKAMACNCSICRRKGSLLHFASADAVTVEGREALTTYTFKSHNIQHHFCTTCGCAPFAEGTAPDGKAMVAINLRCTDGIDPDALEITQFDGASV